ncbi:MAG: HAMP domain-containing histidine kinase [Nonomuraea sp.]|nr:HAMP domain-containing histidine kinase [Nonomuraea sp.]
MLARERAFSVDVSHQLRTRLTATLLGLESALARPDADLRAAIETALGRGEQLRTTVEDLVRLTRDGGHGGGAPLDVVALLNDVRDDRHGEPVTVNVPLGLPHVAASPAAVRQVLQVLLDNATEHGAGEITVDAADLGDAVAIEVSDRGPGIPEGVDPFTRKPDAREGHGIGLALARSLAEAEGGRLVLRESSPPVFSLLLPVSQAHTGSRGHAAS